MATLPSKYSPDAAEESPKTEAKALRDWRQYLRAPRELSLTRPGKFFLLLTLAVGFGAINTGNNLLFLLLGMMLSLIIASGLLSEAVIRNIRIRRRLPRQIEAGQPAPAAFQILNQGFWPALSFEISEQNPKGIAGPAKGIQLGPEKIPWWKFWRSQPQEDIRHVGATYCLRVSGQEELLLKTNYLFLERGRYELPGLQVSTRFPFGFFDKSRLFDAPTHLLVLPSPLPAMDWLGQIHALSGEAARNKQGTGEDFFGLRDYRPGEDQRAIHWKSTARRGAPVVRETEARERRALAIILDNRAPKAHISPSTRLAFEQGIRRLTGLLHLLSRQGYSLEFYSCETNTPHKALSDLSQILRHLAIIELRPFDFEPPSLPAQADKTRTLVHAGFGDVELFFSDSESNTSTKLSPEEF